ncbi:unnamed protein product [Adineta steineri]|uniref:Uncharacterized protein n=1 Tax=Adineta steineri TaxID=433720 RepID=A0A815S3Y3_9BILA|nr:unnamed protein product [Adineta steineri]CAF3882571.1 unnamed protein product [Adineta steineri]
MVWNLSDGQLTEDELYLLENGLSHNRLCTIDRSEVISNVKLLFYQSSDLDSGFNKEIRTLEPIELSFAADLNSVTQKFFNEAQGSIRRKKSFYQSYEVQLLLNLSKNTSIVITKPDKGRGVVIMSRTEYIQKLEQILSDRPKFNLINKDPTGSPETRLWVRK